MLTRATVHRVEDREQPLTQVSDTMSENEDQTIYTVVVNDEEQYSIWPAGSTIPPGWADAGKTGTKADCLEYVKEVWTDMRPKSVRRQLEAHATATN